MKNNPTNSLQDQINKKNNELIIAGLPLAHIEKLVGSTPFYVYDKQKINDKISNLKTLLPKEITLHYAIKANPFPSLVHFMSTVVNGFDVASKKEMLLAMQSGMKKEHICYAGPGKTHDDLQAAIIAGVTLHVESTTEIESAIKLGKALNLKPNIAIRVNPVFELKASGMKMSGGAKPFGIDEELVENILTDLNYQEINFRGFHIFSGSQNLNAQAIIDCHNNLFALAAKLIKITPVSIDYINIGGGFGIPYFNNDSPLDLNPIIQNLEFLIKEYKQAFNNIEIIMELGRYLVGEAGIYVSKVVDKKQSRGTTYLVCDGGLHHHLANSGNFGQVIRKNYPVSIEKKQPDPTTNKETVTIVGPLCTPLDILADKLTLPKASIGDYVVVHQSGAYGASASPKDFLSQPDVYEIFI